MAVTLNMEIAIAIKTKKKQIQKNMVASLYLFFNTLLALEVNP